ncbi:TonB-dependent receptor [Inhella gelatinilytica]|uniref:TonB-dependent receptor n=1 Tax=Inhella gelatinilytica TaxID=2795030 RepID=A0A931IZ20_9BURK|nr:TonB-dependent receptor [Inhella gelatinilytica]MBH9552608.1 TonB-dependent receptor [Inhella gelatinilytica]
MPTLRLTPIAAAASLALLHSLALAQTAPAKKDEPKELEQVVVTGIRASLEASLSAKKKAATNVEVLTAEDVGKMPDKNIADSLARLPGLNMQFGGALAMDEAERIAIRGSSPNLNLTTLNGHALSSGDWHVGDQGSSGRSVGFGLMPSHLIGKAVVYKTGQADITEGGIAGTVDIQFRKPFDMKKGLSAHVSLGVVNATLPGTTDPQGSALLSWSNADRSFGALVQVYREKRHLRRDGQETFSFNNVAANSAAGLANPALVGKRLPGSLNSALFEGVRDREGGALGLQLKPTRNSELNVSAFRSTLKADNYNSSAFALPGTLVNQGANGYLIQNPVIEGDVITKATLVRNPASPATFNVVGMQFDHNQRQGATSLSQFVDVDGRIDVTDRLTLKGRVGTTKGSGVTNAQPSLTFGLLNPARFDYQINTTRPTDYGFSTSTGAPVNLGATNSFSQLSNTGAQVASKDQEQYLHLDGEWRGEWGFFNTLKFGARSAEHTRSYDVVAPRWNAQDRNGAPVSPSPFFSVTGGLLVDRGPVVGGVQQPPIVAPGQLPVPATAYPSDFAAGLNANFPRELFRFDPAQISAFASQFVYWDPVYGKTWTSGYTVKEDNRALYLMGEFESGRLSGNVGLRMAQTKLDSLSYQALPASGANSCAPLAPCAVPDAIVGSVFATYLPQRVQTDRNTGLPSLNLRYDAGGGHIWRASASRTLGRANYNELAGAVSLNNTLLTGSSGNPNLKPITANNADLSYAWYFKPRAYVMAALFSQELKDYVKAGTSQVEYFNTSTNSPSIYTVTSRVGKKASVAGMEAALDMPLGAGFGFGLNGTYVDAQDEDGSPLLGTSKVTKNATLWFENKRFSARLAWNHRSDYAIGFVGNGTNTPNNGVHYYKGSGSISASATWQINDQLSLTLDGNNLNDPVRHTYFITENAPGYWHQSGKQYFLTLRGKL